MNKIESFTGDYRFLSNFWYAEVLYGGYKYPTVEHAYQAAKAATPEGVEKVRLCKSPAEAKKAGREIQMSEDWEEIKLGVMRELLYKKFPPGSKLAAKLLATGNTRLEEGNWWGDTFWGVCKGKGENWLGRLLMEVRDGLRGKVVKQ